MRGPDWPIQDPSPLILGTGRSIDLPLPRGGRPPNRVGGLTAPEATAAIWAASPAGGDPEKSRCCPLICSAMPSLSTAGRPGWMPPAPTGPWEQRCSSVIINPRPWPGGLYAPPQALRSGVPGRLRAHAPPPPAGPGTCVRGPLAPHTSRCPGLWKGVSPTTT